VKKTDGGIKMYIEKTIDKLADAIGNINEAVNKNYNIINKIIEENFSAMIFLQETIRGNASPCGICFISSFCKEENKQKKKTCKDFTLKECK
jgi:hypothetical protein